MLRGMTNKNYGVQPDKCGYCYRKEQLCWSKTLGGGDMLEYLITYDAWKSLFRSVIIRYT